MAEKVNAADPQSDRELLLQLNGQIERLAETIRRLDKTLQEIEDKKLVGLENKIIDIKEWQKEISGFWKGIAAVSVIAAVLGLAALVKSFLK